VILKGSQRGGAKQLAAHLLKTIENEHVEVHEVRGFVSEKLHGALREAYAMAQGTRCRQFLFSLSLNPPPNETVPVRDFEKAIDAIERKLGLEGQPRAVVFHEKDGRRHAHCVWSRINAATMTAINLPHFKLKLRDISKGLYLEHGWQMPHGLMDSKERDPRNFTREQWQQAMRSSLDPKAIKAQFQDCWAVSDSRQAFAKALEERGYTLARGDRRGFVAIDFRGEVYAVSKWTGVRTRDVAAKLGDPQSLPGVEQTKAVIAGRMTAQVRRYIQEAQCAHKKEFASLAFKRADLVQRQRDERVRLEGLQRERWIAETTRRSARLSRGIRGIWDRLTGKYGKTRRENEREAYEAYRRDRREKETLVERQLRQRQTLVKEIRRMREIQSEDMARLTEDVALFMRPGERETPDVQTDFREAAQPPQEPKARDQERDLGRDDGLDFGM
jgi:Relaxase/Mobilisation nuclease domain.